MADKFIDKVIESRTEHVRELGTLSAESLKWQNLGQTISTVHSAITEPILVALSDKWIAVSAFNPATTEKLETGAPNPMWSRRTLESPERSIDRFDYERLWSVQIGEYFMPLSQTFSIKARKKLNTSQLVDGPEVIQQTLKHAKQISCSLRISLREEQTNLQIVDAQNQVRALSNFLQAFYETDAVLEIRNSMINETFGVQYAIMSDYEFKPRAGMNTYTFDFILTEVLYGANVITFNLREIGADTSKRDNYVVR